MSDKPKCKFNESYNPCEFLDHQTSMCSNPNNCSFQEREQIKSPYVRKERWYEQNYKK